MRSMLGWSRAMSVSVSMMRRCSRGIPISAVSARWCRYGGALVPTSTLRPNVSIVARGSGSHAGAVMLGAVVTAAATNNDANTVACEAGVQQLAWTRDRYDGAIIDAESVAHDASTFEVQLEQAERTWKLEKCRGVWLKLPTSHAHLVGVATQRGGFEFHHAEPGYVMLNRWLPEDEPNLMPPGASHQVGIGAVVLNSRGELLVVQERHGPLRGMGVWKVPTGLIHVGENVSDGAVREVEEETGVSGCTFDRVLAVRQAHGFLFGKSDLFFLVALRVNESECKLDSDGRPLLTPQLEELEGCRWIDVSEYAAGQEKAFADRYQRVHESLNRAISTYQQGEYGGLVVDNLMPLPSSSSSVKADDPPRRLQLLLTSARNLNGKEDERSKL